MNYDLKMQEEINALDYVPKILLHACCAPCSSTCLKRLGEHFKITIFYYNPNITEKTEYNKRLEEIKKFIKEFKVKYEIEIIEGKYNKEAFFEIARGLEEIPERGLRCFKCYKLRLTETLKIAEEKGFDYFATTLTLSPYKNANWINEIGEELAKESHVKYLYSDFKKQNGYKQSIEYSNKYKLYRQDYCGCIYSQKTKRKEEIEK